VNAAPQIELAEPCTAHSISTFERLLHEIATRFCSGHYTSRGPACPNGDGALPYRPPHRNQSIRSSPSTNKHTPLRDLVHPWHLLLPIVLSNASARMFIHLPLPSFLTPCYYHLISARPLFFSIKAMIRLHLQHHKVSAVLYCLKPSQGIGSLSFRIGIDPGRVPTRRNE
jgi:hypothetical protein